MRRPQAIRRTFKTALLGVLAVATVACGTDTPTDAPTSAPTPEPTAVVSRYSLSTAVWYAGLKVTFASATATLDARGGSVEVDTLFENPGAFSAALAAPIALAVGEDAYELKRGTELPEVPAGGTTELTLTFDVLGRSSVDDAVLRIGAPDNHQALIPLLPGTVQPVTLEPVTVGATGTGVVGELTVALRGGVLRWDLPDWSAELPLTSEALTLTYDVTYTGKFSGGFPFTGANIALQLPDGTGVEPRKDGHSQTNEAVDPGATVLGVTRFEIPAGTRGAFALVIKNDQASTTIAFSIDG